MPRTVFFALLASLPGSICLSPSEKHLGLCQTNPTDGGCISRTEWVWVDGNRWGPTPLQGLCMSFSPSHSLTKVCKDSACYECTNTSATRGDCVAFSTPGVPIKCVVF